MFHYLAFVLLLSHVNALPTATPSASANIIAGDPIPTATGPTCIQTRSPDGPSASDINVALEDDNTISKACDVTTQGTTTLDDGLLSLSVIFYGLNNQYFFNSSHNADIVSRPIADPNLCPDTFHDIFSACVMNQNFWGGWVMRGGTNRSITNSVFPANPLSQKGAGSTTSTELPGTQNPDTTTFEAGTQTTGGQETTRMIGEPTGSGDPSSTGVFVSGEDSTGLPDTITGASSTTTANEGGSITTRGQPPVIDPSSVPSIISGSQQTGGQPPATATTNTEGQNGEQMSTQTDGRPPETNTDGRPPTSEPIQQASRILLPSGGTVLFTTLNSQVYSQTFVPTTFSEFATLASTLTTSTIDSHSSSVPLVIGPGGVAWVPFGQPSGTNPLSPPTILPTNPNAPNQPKTTGVTTDATNGAQGASSSVQSSSGAASTGASITPGGSLQTPPPGTTRGGDNPTTESGNGPTTGGGDSPTTAGPLPIITTSYDPEASTVTSIGPEITGNTAIRTSDDRHGAGIYPFWRGGRNCFIICPAGIDNGGIILWGMDKPGIYPPPTPPPFPDIKWPTITIDEDLKPTATEEPEDEQTSSEDDDSSTEDSTAKSTAQSTAHTTSKPTSSFQSSSSSSSRTGTYVTATQEYILAIETVGIEELKQRNSWMVKYHHQGTNSGASGTTGVSSASRSAAVSTTNEPFPSSTRPPSTAAGTRHKPTAQPSRTINPADCPNDGVRQNAPYCPTPSSATGFSCGLASNVGVATYSPATWCACQNPENSYPTMSGEDPCGYATPPATAIHPSAVKPTTIGPLSDCSLVQTTVTGTIAPGPQTYCTCGPVIAGINTQTSDGMVYSVCAGDPYPTIASSKLPEPTEAPAPKASQAIIIYREDSCGDTDCSTLGHVYQITPGQPVDPCSDDDIFSASYTQSSANDDSDYTVNLGPFEAWGYDNLQYSGSNKNVGYLSGVGEVEGESVSLLGIQCIVPAAQGTSCTSSNSIQAVSRFPSFPFPV
ncbi:MAG: hypothetical protein Q9166_000847 [cf. Caloplaca sp. 2 TL-2023]